MTYERPVYGGYKRLNKEKCRDCQYFCEECIRINNRVDTPHAERDALCWCCRHCTDGQCNFMMKGIIPEGAIFFQRTLTDGTDTVNIRTCPNFVRG